MSPMTTAPLRKAAHKATTKAADALKDAGRTVKQEIRRRRIKQRLRAAGEAAVLVGTAALADMVVKQADWVARRFGKQTRLGLELTLPLGLEAAVARIGEVLRTQGFGILTRIDVHATLQEKLGVSFRPYVILGACNPALAHRALSARAESGLLLPCNITVEQLTAHHTVIRIANPEVMLQVGGLELSHELRAVAVEAKRLLWLAAEALRTRLPSAAS